MHCKGVHMQGICRPWGMQMMVIYLPRACQVMYAYYPAQWCGTVTRTSSGFVQP